MRKACYSMMAMCFLVGLACAGCKQACEAGTEGCPCYDNDTCNTGLSCASDLCVYLDSSDAGSKTDAGGYSSKTPAQACEDLAEAFADKLTRCAEEEVGVSLTEEEYRDVYMSGYDNFVEAAVGGDCHNVETVRDEDALYEGCLPGLDALSCEDIWAGNLPTACNKQLIRS